MMIYIFLGVIGLFLFASWKLELELRWILLFVILSLCWYLYFQNSYGWSRYDELIIISICAFNFFIIRAFSDEDSEVKNIMCVVLSCFVGGGAHQPGDFLLKMILGGGQ